jgi:hypothetical protein
LMTKAPAGNKVDKITLTRSRRVTVLPFHLRLSLLLDTVIFQSLPADDRGKRGKL